MINFYDILELAQLRAINFAIDPTAESIFRMRCRDYSQKFFTPLHKVMELDPLFIMQTLYEEQYHPSIVDEEINDLMEKLYIMKDPNHIKISEQETEDLVDAVMNKEIARAARKKRPTEQTLIENIKESTTVKIKPKSGSMNFDDLGKMDSETEGNKAGF